MSTNGDGRNATDPDAVRYRTPAGDESLAFLEPSQLVANTSRPVARAPISRAASIWLWVLRIVVMILGLMVIYAFVAQLAH